MPKLSVIIPVYNAESTLRRCLDSILSQSFRDLEIICVDDGSSDGSADILQEYVLREPRVHASAFQRRLETVLARKLALLDAQGKYIMFADADDMLLPGACETAVRLIEKSNCDVVQFSVDFEAEEKDIPALETFTPYFVSRVGEIHGTNILYDCFVNHRFPHNLWNKIYRADICREAVNAMPDIKLHHYTDLYLSFFILFFAESFRSFRTVPCYRYHFGGGVSTKVPDSEQFLGLCESGRTLPLMEKFLRDRNAYETNVSVLDAIRSAFSQDIVNKLLTIPNLTREIITAAMDAWGGDIIFRFLEQTGMFKYPCDSRLNLVSLLIERYNADRKTIAKLQSDLDSAQAKMRKMSPRSSQVLRSPARATSRLPSPVSSTIRQEITSSPQRVQFRFVQKLPKV
ncbi:MAG: glycosyltransferase [Lentisphaeria bacterium]|nr:glycosyltransferase [Lentisphaeria bacterium]